MAKSLDSSSNESLNATIERDNIGKDFHYIHTLAVRVTVCACSLVIDVKLPTKEELMTIDDITFPEEAELTNNDFISKGQIIIPTSIILHQFEIKGTYVYVFPGN